MVIQNPDGKTTNKKWIFCQMYQGLKNAVQTPDNISRYEPPEDSFLARSPRYVFEYLAMVNGFLRGEKSVKHYPARYEIRVRGHKAALACLAKAKKPGNIKFYVSPTYIILKYLSQMTDIWKHIFITSRKMYSIGPLRKDFLKIIRLLMLSLFRGWEYVLIRGHTVSRKEQLFLYIDQSIKNYSFPYIDPIYVDFKQLRLKDSLDFSHKASFDEDLPFGSTVPDFVDKGLEIEAMEMYHAFRIVWNEENPLKRIALILNKTAQDSIMKSIANSYIHGQPLKNIAYCLSELKEMVNLEVRYQHFSYIHLFDTIYATNDDNIASNFWWKKCLHVYFYRYFMKMFKTTNKHHIADALDLELQILLCEWEFFPFIQRDRIWGNCDSDHKVLRVFVVEDLLGMKTELQESQTSSPKCLDCKTIAKNLFKSFLVDVWLDIDNYVMEIYGQLEERARMARNPNLSLSDLMETFELHFFDRIGFPGKFVKVTKKSKDWNARFNHFFSLLKLNDNGRESKFGRKTYAIQWNQILEKHDQTQVNKIIQELFSFFQKLEWFPNHQGYKTFWRKCRSKNDGENFEVVRRSDFFRQESNSESDQFSKKGEKLLFDETPIPLKRIRIAEFDETHIPSKKKESMDIPWIGDRYPSNKMYDIVSNI